MTSIMDRELDFIAFAEAEDAANHQALGLKMALRWGKWSAAFNGRTVRKYADYKRRGWVFMVELPFVLPIRGASNPLFNLWCCDCLGTNRPCGCRP